MAAARSWAAGACAGMVLAQGCAAGIPRPLDLPPRGAPLEERVVAYRERAAMPHLGTAGWEMRVGDGPVEDLTRARAFLANAAEAEEVLHARDNQIALGWGLLGGGIAVMLSSLIALPFSLDRGRDERSLVVPFALLGLGTAIALPSAFIMGAAQRRVPVAAEAYNRWLWRALDLPRTDVPATPHPTLSPAPWTDPR